jgi:hypothetical protein
MPARPWLRSPLRQSKLTLQDFEAGSPPIRACAASRARVANCLVQDREAGVT